jgi:leucyl aminopeptidase (aminopeptidase T)
MKSILMMKTAQMVVQNSAGIRPGENVCIVCDTNSFAIAKVLAAASHAAGAETVLVMMTAREMNKNEPPPVVASAMLAADVILALTTHGIIHTDARLAASKRGARTLSMRNITEETMIAGAMLADYNEVSAMTTRLAEILTEGRTIRLTTSLGTDATFHIEGRKGLALGGLATEPGGVTTLPSGEATIAPIEGATEGKLIIDFAMDEIGRLSAPICLNVRQGKVVSIEGGREAGLLEQLLAGDESAFNISEFAIGTNPKSRMKGSMGEDKICKGCVHVAVGDNHAIGGKAQSNVHLDGIILGPTVEIDGRLIVAKGVLQPLD